MQTTIKRITRPLDAFILKVGQIGAWALIPVITVVILDVITRRLFTYFCVTSPALCVIVDAMRAVLPGSVVLQELEWHFHAITFLLCASWTYLNDGHVRVDIFYAKMTERGKAWVDFLGGIVFTIPFCVTMIALGSLFVQDSFSMHEVSDAPGGLPYRYAIKLLFPAGFVLLLIQGISSTLKNFLFLKTGQTLGRAA
jgi:TRAP-type mannitol/chloroaromatic compound transport system permease small subunit